MATAGIPNNFTVQQANGQVLLTWSISPGATSYQVQRSTDGVNYSNLAVASVNQYIDQSVSIGVQYFYQVASVNTSGLSSFTTPQSAVPTNAGTMSLGELRLRAQQRADRVGSDFVTTAEWNSNINNSAFELYNLLITTYEDYYFATPYLLTTDGVNQQFALPQNFMKLRGVDLTIGGGRRTLKRFNFIDRNKNFYQTLTNPLGLVNLRYDIVGNTIFFDQIPQAGLQITLWFIPRMTQLLADTDILDGISGWTEYVIVDAAIKALWKEESFEAATGLNQQKLALQKMIEESAANRDAGEPETISDVRSANLSDFGFDGGGFGGYGVY